MAVLTFIPLAASADAPAQNRVQARFEVRFMTEMIDHHAMALEMGALCVEKAVHPELKQLCEEMIAAQTAEIATMQTWLQDWYGVTHEPEMSPEDEQQIEELVSLSGEEFEIEFMRMMIRHHATAVVRGVECVRRAPHRDLKELCHEMVKAQLSEIRTMQGWLCHWYEVCSRRHSHGRSIH